MSNCLYCYQSVEQSSDFHEKCSREFFGSGSPPKVEYSLDEMVQLAQQVIERSISVPGVQPKLSMSTIRDAVNKHDSRLTIVGALGGEYIFKPPSTNYPNMPEIEHLTMRIAESYGIRTVPSTLIRIASGELAYITKRIDRSKSGQKVHMIDFYQITEAFDKYKGSVERVGKALVNYSSAPVLDAIFLLELIVFCFLTGNNDMHLKNFSMIKTSSGWNLAPAYDLLNINLILPEDDEELALTLSGKKRKLKLGHFTQFGLTLGLTDKQIESVFKRMISNKWKADQWISNSFLPDSRKSDYREILNQKYNQLELLPG